MNKYSGALARRYGTALFEILVSSSKNKTDFEKQVKNIQTLSSFFYKKIVNYFVISSLSDEEKIGILEYFLHNTFEPGALSPEIISFLKLVLVNKRFKEIKPIIYFFLTKADEYLDIARATIITARKIQENDSKEFESILKEVLNKNIVFKAEVDESLKAGFIVKLGHVKIDSSFKSRLNGLKELFI